jgi:transcriptional regulator with XRE-family HTH domain
MRVYLNATALGAQLTTLFRDRNLSQAAVASDLGVTQGEVSRILRGRFKTLNTLVTKLCTYVNIDPRDFRQVTKAATSRADAILALSLACKGQKSRERTVVRILRAIQDLT